MGIPLLFGRDVSAADDTTGVPVARGRRVDRQAILDRTQRDREAHPCHRRHDVADDRRRRRRDSRRRRDAAAGAAPLCESRSERRAARVAGDPRGRARLAGAVRSVRSALSRIDSSIPLDRRAELASVVGDSLATKRLTEILLAAFAAVAVLLAAVGIYGVMSLSVANRRREFGVRLAVGAEPRALVRLVLKEGAVVAAVGVGIGVIGALVATRWMASLLYDVSPTDPIVFVSLSVCWARSPSRRASFRHCERQEAIRSSRCARTDTYVDFARNACRLTACTVPSRSRP